MTVTKLHLRLVEIKNEDVLTGYLDEYMNANGEVPHLAGLDAEGVPFTVWLNEEGGDGVYLNVARLEEEDGGTAEHPSWEMPGQGEVSSLSYPVTIIGE